MRALLTALTLMLLAAPAHAADTPKPGDVSYQLIGTYDRERFEKIAGDELRAFTAGTTQPDAYLGKLPTPKYAVSLYKVTYASIVPELANRPTTATGLLAIPETGLAAMPIVSYQHGTVFDRRFVPSQPEKSDETRLVLTRFAAQGDIVIAADYFGRGDSRLPDSYMARQSTQQATYDMLRAARVVLAARNITPTRLFLSGWSQGGWATMAFLQKLEAKAEAVTAVAIASGPMDIAVAVNRWVNNPQAIDAVYLPAIVGIQLQAKAYYSNLPNLDAAAIRPEYLAAARDLYAGRIDYAAFAARTPPRLADFLKESFRANLALGNGPYWRLLDASQVYRWQRRTPVRSWYGGADEVTPKALALLPAEAAGLLGGASFEVLDAGDRADHRGVFVHALIDQKAWFDSFAAH